MDVGFTMDFRNARREPWPSFWEDRLWLFKEAEAMGFDYLSVQEHFFTEDGYAPSVPIFLTALVERTKRCRLGTYTYILPLHHAAQLAQETAILDQMSGGRLDVTVGAGHRPAEYRAWGYNPKTRPSRMEEGLEVLKLAWKGERFSYRGKYYDLDNLIVTPEPFQKPHPRLWVAATAPAAAERAGRHGANLHPAALDQPFFDAYFRGLAQSGVDPNSVRISTTGSFTVTDEDPEKVWERNKPLYFERWDFYTQIRDEMGDRDLPHGGRRVDADSYRDAEQIGDAEAVIDIIRQRKQALPFLTDVMHAGPAGGVDIRTEAYRSLKRFAEEVLPAVKAM